MKAPLSPPAARAQRILEGVEPWPPLNLPALAAAPDGEPGPPPASLRDLIAELRAGLDFRRARKLLDALPTAALGAADRLWVVQQRALCTYKDEDLVPGPRFERALALLDSIGLCHPELEDRETLNLGGAVYKRRWEVDGQLEHLYAALSLYMAAWQRGDPRNDLDGRLYGAVNAAFVLDLLADRGRRLARRTGTSGEMAHLQAQRAQELRQEALALLERNGQDDAAQTREWWTATRAELLFGVGRYDEAGVELQQLHRRYPPDDSRLHSTARQLIALAGALPGIPPPPVDGTPRAVWTAPWRALGELFGPHAAPALGTARGKVGLALSGGGFRASLFHLGVLARLAEMDVLHSVEVVSTVSGGSIVGAHYYLALREALRSQADIADPAARRALYVGLVQAVSRQFVRGVQKNMRMRTLSSLRANLHMAFRRHYTRSHRLGELYDEHFYAQVRDTPLQGERRRMLDLLIQPAGDCSDFKPRFMNWRRHTKVPVLLVNATSLNSGHNWQFTGRWMGEPPETFDAGVDMNVRYRRLWWDDAPSAALRDLPLGDAVAASACVPGLFEPLVLAGLYPGRTVRLVDGGVHDNQGVASLLGEGCTLVLCSDASGQMADLERPPDSRVGVPLRANGILMDRVREAQYQDLRARVQSRSLKGLFFAHLQQGLDAAPLDWTGCSDPGVSPPQFCATTDYGIDKTLQRQLSAMRTDLDSFSEVEAQMLMLSGYLMTEHNFRRLQQEHEEAGELGTWGGFAIDAPRGEWGFLQLEALARLPPDAPDRRRQELGRLIGAGAMLFFRIWGLDHLLKAVAIVCGLALALALVASVALHWQAPLGVSTPQVSVGQLVLALAAFAAALWLPVMRWLNPARAMRGVLVQLGLALAGWVTSNIHLAVFDRRFLRLGRVRRLLRLR